MLTARKIAFVDYYKSTGNATEAAKLAGYKGKYVNRSASRLLHDVDISSQLKSFVDERKEKYSRDNFIDTAWKEYETLEEEPTKIRALELAGRALGHIGVNSDSRPNQTLNVQINLSGNESQNELWEAARKLLGNE